MLVATAFASLVEQRGGREEGQVVQSPIWKWSVTAVQKLSLPDRANLSETKFNALSPKWLNLPTISYLIRCGLRCTKNWESGKFKYLWKCTKFKIRDYENLQQEKSITMIGFNCVLLFLADTVEATVLKWHGAWHCNSASWRKELLSDLTIKLMV